MLYMHIMVIAQFQQTCNDIQSGRSSIGSFTIFAKHKTSQVMNKISMQHILLCQETDRHI